MRHLIGTFLLLQSLGSFSQTNWASNPFEQKAFVENKGQFPRQMDNARPTEMSFGQGKGLMVNGRTLPVLFGASCEGTELYFTAQGLSYRHDEYPVFSKEEREKIEEGQHLAPSKMKTISHFLHITWEGANKNVKVVAEDAVSYYYTYPDNRDASGKSSLKASAYKKIIYRDMYANIDVEYTFPTPSQTTLLSYKRGVEAAGIKYSIILHPGADPSQIKMKYLNAQSISLDASGNIVIQSSFGEFIDHAPQTFYADNHQTIFSSFAIKNNVVSFSIPNYQNSSSPLENRAACEGCELSSQGGVIIDPWVTNPVFPGYNAAYDLEYDFAGNVYAYGGASPYIEIKMNNAGAIQWIYTATLFTHIGYYGDLAVDPVSGSSYVVEGTYWPFSPGGSRVAKVDASGAQIAMFPTGNSTMKEAWRAVYDNCNKKIVIAGSSFNNPTRYQGYILDTNCVNLTSVNVLTGTTFALNEQDMCMLAQDNSGNVFMGNCGNKFLKVPAATLAPTAYVLPNNHSFTELSSIEYIRNINPSSCGMNAMAASGKYVYTYDGGLLQRWNKNTGAFMNGTTLSATKFRWGGITVDECDNIFVGTPLGVTQYDTTFTVVTTIPSPAGTDTVYDVRLAPGNMLYVCGKSYVASFQLSLPACGTSFSVTATAVGSCTGQGSATATATGGNAPYTYSWSPTGGTGPNATGLFAGNYTVTVTDNTACAPKFQTATVTVTSGGSNMTVTNAQSNLLCNGGLSGSATVTPAGGTAPYTYSWSPAAGSASSATGLSAGTYTVLVTDSTGCVLSQIIIITQPAPIVITASSTSTTCTSNNGTASANTSGGTPGYAYLWNNGQTTSTALALSGGAYSVTVTDANGCTKTQSVSVSSGGSLIVSTSSTQSGCSINNGTATANSSSGTTPYTYSWSNGQTAQTATGLAAGNYSVIVTDASGCVQGQNVVITQTPGPVASAIAGTTSISIGAGTTLTGSGGGTYQWSPTTGLSCITCANPATTPSQTTEYCVLVTDINNCSDSACITIYVDIPCGNIYIPNAFSPNNDLENDLECVMGSCIEAVYLSIYNRWGEKVFEYNGSPLSSGGAGGGPCWDGTYKGKPLNTAVFSYYLEATFSSGEKINKKGNISLLR